MTKEYDFNPIVRECAVNRKRQEFWDGHATMVARMSVLNEVVDQMGLIRDGHNSGTEFVQIDYLLEFKSERGQTFMCAAFSNRASSLNPVVLDADGMPYLHPHSVGGPIAGINDPTLELKVPYKGQGKIVMIHSVRQEIALGKRMLFALHRATLRQQCDTLQKLLVAGGRIESHDIFTNVDCLIEFVDKWDVRYLCPMQEGDRQQLIALYQAEPAGHWGAKILPGEMVDATSLPVAEAVKLWEGEGTILSVINVKQTVKGLWEKAMRSREPSDKALADIGLMQPVTPAVNIDLNAKPDPEAIDNWLKANEGQFMEVSGYRNKPKGFTTPEEFAHQPPEEADGKKANPVVAKALGSFFREGLESAMTAPGNGSSKTPLEEQAIREESEKRNK